MYSFITILICLVALVLIGAVLVQNSKGGGLSSGFSSSNAIMGAPKTADFLEKSTWTLAGVLLVLCILTTPFIDRGTNVIQSDLSGQIQAPVSTDFQESALPQQPSVEAPDRKSVV